MSFTDKNTISAAFIGLPGTSKSTCGLSFPGVEQNVWGAGEELTAKNFSNRSDILPHRKWDWFNYLSDEDKVKLVDESKEAWEKDIIINKAKYKCICAFESYIYKLKVEIPQDKRPELKTFFLDNGTPFADTYKAYVLIKHEDDIITDKGNFDGRKFYPKYATDLSTFFQTLVSLPINVVVAFHTQYSVDEENAAKVMEKEGQKLPKEWLPDIEGRLRFQLGGLFSYAFFLKVVEEPGKGNTYIAKLEADESTVGIAKSRFQPFENPRKIVLPKNNFYEFLVENINNAVSKQTVTK